MGRSAAVWFLRLSSERLYRLSGDLLCRLLLPLLAESAERDLSLLLAERERERERDRLRLSLLRPSLAERKEDAGDTDRRRPVSRDTRLAAGERDLDRDKILLCRPSEPCCLLLLREGEGDRLRAVRS